jgi:hypothetical protein
MVQPFDYRLNLPSPFEAFSQGMQIGAARRQIERERAAEEEKRRKAEEAAKMREEISAWTRNPTPDGFNELIGKYPEAFEQLSKMQKFYSDTDSNMLTNLSAQALAAHRNKRPEQVVSLIDERIRAYDGNPEMVKMLTDLKTGYLDPNLDEKAKESAIATSLIVHGGEQGKRIYDTTFKQTDPWVAVAGVGVFSRTQLEQAFAKAEEEGKGTVELPPAVPQEAVDLLKNGDVTPEVFDKRFGSGAAAKVLGGGSMTQPAPASQTITQGEAARMRKTMTSKQFADWLRKNNVEIVGK